MSDKLPIDRVRSREEDGPDTFDTARETYALKEDKLDREASQEAPDPEDEESFRKRMEEKLAESQNDSESP